MAVSGELRLGGHYQLERNAGGTIETCDPPTGFTATWEYGGEVSWIELSLTPEPGGGTRFSLEHIGRVDDTRWTEYGPGAVGVGWDLGVLGLARHLDGGETVKPEDGAAWMASDDGRRFITLSSEGWFAASVRSGDDEAAARAAADRTTAAYAPPPA
jgi:hypothetical protein